MNNLIKGAVCAMALGLATTSGIFIGHATADQPHMQAALDSLVAARDELVAASPNKGGHRLEAIRLTNLAIAEVHAGIAAAEW
ncbi:MAG: hypothetical protein ABSA49_02200 [Rhizomicrobium sp.]|jgi:hypothetical protein